MTRTLMLNVVAALVVSSPLGGCVAILGDFEIGDAAVDARAPRSAPDAVAESAPDAVEVDVGSDAARAPAAKIIALGEYHSCALETDGTVACWGLNGNGQLGDGTTTDRASPTAVPGLSDVAEIALGSAHSCARKTDGTVACWGANIYGQLGDGTTTDRLSPTAVL